MTKKTHSTPKPSSNTNGELLRSPLLKGRAKVTCCDPSAMKPWGTPQDRVGNNQYQTVGLTSHSLIPAPFLLKKAKKKPKKAKCDSCGRIVRKRSLLQFKGQLLCYKCYVESSSVYLLLKHIKVQPKPRKSQINASKKKVVKKCSKK